MMCKDNFLEKSLENAEALKKDYGAAVAYEYLMKIVYFRVHGDFPKPQNEE